MKILQINKYHYPNGGSETVYFNTCNLLKEHGHSVIHFCMKSKKNLDSPTKEFFPDSFDFRKDGMIQKIKNSIRFFYNTDAEKKLEQLVLKEKPDIAHVHLFYNSLSVVIFKVLKKHNIPVVLMLHDHRLLCPSSLFLLRGNWCKNCQAGLYTNCTFHKCYQEDRLYSMMLTFELWQREFFFRLNKYIDKYLFISHFQVKTHLSYHKYYNGKYIRLYNFIPSLDKISADYKRGEYLFFYGRITDEKGIRTLINVARKLNSFQFKIAGTGPLMEELQSINLPNVEFVGFQTGEALQDLIKNASFVITPSEGIENNPLTIIESYTYGKPCIASKIGGIPEIVMENETGFLFETKSEDDLSEKILLAQSLSDDEYMRLSRNARNFADQNFNPQIYYQKLIDMYKELILQKKNKYKRK